MDTKSELLDPKKEKSPTCCNFEIFDHDPQLDMKFEIIKMLVTIWSIYDSRQDFRTQIRKKRPRFSSKLVILNSCGGQKCPSFKPNRQKFLPFSNASFVRMSRPVCKE